MQCKLYRDRGLKDTNYQEYHFPEIFIRICDKLTREWLLTRLEDDDRLLYVSRRWKLKAEVRLNKINKRTFTLHHRVKKNSRYVWYYEKYEFPGDGRLILVRSGIYPYDNGPWKPTWGEK